MAMSTCYYINRISLCHWVEMPDSTQTHDQEKLWYPNSLLSHGPLNFSHIKPLVWTVESSQVGESSLWQFQPEGRIVYMILTKIIAVIS